MNKISLKSIFHKFFGIFIQRGDFMAKHTVFIDGSAGTTGLQIHERIKKRDDIELISLPTDKRKDPQCRKEALNAADVAFLCLPDEASIEAVSMVDNPHTVIIDASTAHRTLPNWAYGFPELSSIHEEKVAAAKRIAVPGCHASGFIALIYPLIANRLLPKDTLLVCHSLTGYSGGGKTMIADYEKENKAEELFAPRQYALSQNHKHLREMKAITGLDSFPIFCPIVDDFYSGMEVSVPLFTKQLYPGVTADDIRNVYRASYTGGIVSYDDALSQNGMLSAGLLHGSDGMRLVLCGNEDRLLPIALYDNLGKGASGAAVECMNLVLGLDKAYGLNI